MNMNEAVAYIDTRKKAGASIFEIISIYGAQHQTGAKMLEDGTITVFEFPEGSLLILPTGEVWQHRTPAERPAQCRERLRAEGKAYARGGCYACGNSVRTRMECPHGSAP